MKHDEALKILVAHAMCNIVSEETSCDKCPGTNYGLCECKEDFFESGRLKDAVNVVRMHLLNK